MLDNFEQVLAAAPRDRPPPRRLPQRRDPGDQPGGAARLRRARDAGAAAAAARSEAAAAPRRAGRDPGGRALRRAREGRQPGLRPDRGERRAPWPGSASAWTGCRWRSSWRRRGCACSPPDRLLARLAGRLELLTGGASDRDERQQTLRGAIAWSHDLLPEPEQILFRRLAVFAGGGTLEAAEAVADPDVTLDALDGLEALVEQSLLRQEDGRPATRFPMLETIREFAAEQLTEAGEADADPRRPTPATSWRWRRRPSRS